MGNKTHAALRDRAEEIFEDASNAIITEAVWASALQDGVVEESQFVPNEVKHILNTFNASKELDISTITGLNYIQKVEFPVAKDPRVFRNFSHWGDTVELDIQNSARPSASSLGDLTGTVTFSDGSTAISGSGTAFTTELEEGWYIKKSTSSTWHRIATITDDTNLVLVTQVATADDGADTAGATDYWYQYAYLYCAKAHYLSILTDLAGAIDLAGGYEAGAMLIHINSLQDSGTITKNTILTIAGVSGSYRVTEDATIASNECDVKISPSLSGDVANTAVVTIKSSSLTSELERILPELAAGMVARNWVGDARSQVDLAVTAAALGSTHLAAAIVDVGNMQTDVTDNKTAFDLAIGKIVTSLDLAVTAISDSNSLINIIPVGSDPVGKYLNKAIAGANIARGFAAEAEALGSERHHYAQLILNQLQASQVALSEATARLSIAGALNSLQRWADRKIAQAREDLRRLSKPRQKNFGYSRA